MTSPNPAEETQKQNEDYEILNEEYAQYDLSFKIIVIGNSGKEIFLLIQKINDRCRKIMFINTSNKAEF